jgi:hypothetical protein
MVVGRMFRNPRPSRTAAGAIAARLGATAEAQRLAAEAESSTRRHQLSEHFHALAVSKPDQAGNSWTSP